MKRKQEKGINAVHWFYSQPGFHQAAEQNIARIQRLIDDNAPLSLAAHLQRIEDAANRDMLRILVREAREDHGSDHDAWAEIEAAEYEWLRKWAPDEFVNCEPKED